MVAGRTRQATNDGDGRTGDAGFLKFTKCEKGILWKYSIQNMKTTDLVLLRLTADETSLAPPSPG